uniref:Uncharacterized protein n=1 Tax=Glossina palpalis gambiensis TaxID=67801 RepID=A0A1B0B4S8_9MUSC
MRRRWAQFINQDHRPEVATHLLELQKELEALTKERSLSPASHARNVRDEPPTYEKGIFHPSTSAETLLGQSPDWQSTPSFPGSGRHKIRHRSGQQMGAQLYRQQKAAYLHRADQRASRGITS